METTDEQIIASKGDFDQPGQITPWLVSFPFADKGDTESKEYRATFVQRANEVTALPQGSVHPVDSTAVIIEQTPAEPFEGAMVKFDRVYSNAHLSPIAGKNGTGIVEYESRLYDVYTVIQDVGSIIVVGVANTIGFKLQTNDDGIAELQILGAASIILGGASIGDVIQVFPVLETTGTTGTITQLPASTSPTVLKFKTKQIYPEEIFTGLLFSRTVFPVSRFFLGEQKPIMSKITKRYTLDDPFSINLQKKFSVSEIPRDPLDPPRATNVATSKTNPNAEIMVNLKNNDTLLRAEDDVVTEWRGNMREIKTIEVRASDAIGS